MASMHEFGPGAEELAESMFAWTVERLRSEPALRPPPEPAVLSSAIGPIADEGLPPAEVMALWEERIAPATLPVDHPRHMAFIPGAPTPAATLAELLRQQGYAADAAMACAVNREFVPRAQWAAHALDDGDRIDVVAPITGG